MVFLIMLTKMKVFFVALVVFHLFVTKSMASSAYGWFKNKGDDTLELGVNTTGPNHQYSESGSRRAVVHSTHPCYIQYFVGHTPPTGFRPPSRYIKHICQQINDYSDDTFYSTMYDDNIGMTVYAAYGVAHDAAELIGTFPRISKWIQDPEIQRQGSDQLYHNSDRIHHIHKGHMVPAQTYSFDCMNMVSTFRYTNAVPQYAAFNTGPWGRYERLVRDFAYGVCRLNNGDLYLLTGTSEVKVTAQGVATAHALNYFPDNNQAIRRNIAIPNSMWTAGCCINRHNGNPVGAFAAIGNNVQINPAMHETTVKKLQEILEVGTGRGPIVLFPGNQRCSDDTVQYQYSTLAVHQGWSKSKTVFS